MSKRRWSPPVSWQPTLAAEDDDWTLAMYPYTAPAPKLSKRERKAKKRADKLARLAAAERLDALRQVSLDDAPGRKLRVIFTDFDGVLNQHSSGSYELRHEQVERLDRLARDTGAVVVVSSWWRWIGVTRLRDDLASAGFHGRLIGRTPWLGETEAWDARERGTEVAAVLAYLGDRVESFVILDDHDRMGDLLPHLVQTNATEGLTEADAEQARAILYPNPLTATYSSTYTLCNARYGA